jgi:hypothetical protein
MTDDELAAYLVDVDERTATAATPTVAPDAVTIAHAIAAAVVSAPDFAASQKAIAAVVAQLPQPEPSS